MRCGGGGSGGAHVDDSACGEAAALLGVEREVVESGRLAAARELAGRYGAAVLLKGSTTVVAEAGVGGAVRVNPTGTPWLATAGSGDVLSGLGGSLLAAGLSAVDAGSVAAYLHGLAGRFAAEGAAGERGGRRGADPGGLAKRGAGACGAGLRLGRGAVGRLRRSGGGAVVCLRRRVAVRWGCA
ncbi:NAD(P)H-hydrate dehydratase [Streptomyces sp. MMS20-AI2-20]|uniref:ADP-dependent NAD(P)H-hydrate dehydratase n=1 Tax=Streptomyces sp. MMS20-AI2-20 TaxID=2925835 RepID=UPI0027E4EB7F|nr:NAD(P)H-hydrate dehydratase [Streptomyces sp. MMS20-AI2-20]